MLRRTLWACAGWRITGFFANRGLGEVCDDERVWERRQQWVGVKPESGHGRVVEIAG